MIPVSSLPISLTDLVTQFCQKHQALERLHLAIETQGADVRFVAFLDTDSSIMNEQFKSAVIDELGLDTPIVFDQRISEPRYCIYESENNK